MREVYQVDMEGLTSADREDGSKSTVWSCFRAETGHLKRFETLVER